MDTKDNTLGISWHDSAWIPNLNPANIIDYFSERSNPFYDRTCNNEIVKMQRLNPEQLNNMTGMEYILLHCQEPILYVVRKQHRHSPQQVTPLADYYIIAGVVYQAPDIGSVINSRILSAVHHIQTAFENTLSYSRYHPSKGYWWDFSDIEGVESSKKAKNKTKEEPSSLFQRQRVDILLGELAKKYPPKFTTPTIAATHPPPAATQQPPSQPQQQLPQQTPISQNSASVPVSTTTTATTDSKSATKEDPICKVVEIKKESNSVEKTPDSNNVASVKSTMIKQPPAEKRPRL
ncbi:Thioredoxin- transmembrane protein 1 [Chamberlinius hualienensis]